MMSRANSANKSSLPLYLVNLLALAGVGVSVFLTQHFYDVRNGTSGFKSFCNISQAFNCDIVAASPYAELIPGFPLSSFAAGWFLALFLISLIAHKPFWRREALRASFCLTLFGTLLSLPYIAIMVFHLKAICLLCLGVDGLNLASLILVLMLKPETISIHRPEFSKWKVLVGILAGSLLVSTLSLQALDSFSIRSSDVNELANSVLTSPILPVKSGPEYPSFGPKNAPVTIVEFSDYQCPYCRIAAYYLHSVTNRFPTQVRVVFRNFPLDQSCNPLVQNTMHPVACEAARVGLCAHQQNKFAEMYEILFDKQATFIAGRPLELAKELGLDIDQMQGCMNSPETASWIARDIEEGTSLGINGTPTFFVNGHKVTGASPPRVWEKIVQKLLSP